MIENSFYSETIKNDRFSNKIEKIKMFSWPEREQRLNFKTWHTNSKNIPLKTDTIHVENARSAPEHASAEKNKSPMLRKRGERLPNSHRIHFR